MVQVYLAPEILIKLIEQEEISMAETKCERMYYTAQDLQEMLGISRALAYKILKKMNADLEARGFLVIPGRIPKAYFAEHYYGMAN